MPDYLPPIVTKLEGELADLVAKLAEAKALMSEFNKSVRDESDAAGKDAGKGLGGGLLDEFQRALDEGRPGLEGEFGRTLGAFEPTALATGRRAGESLVDQLKRVLQQGQLGEMDMQRFADDADAEFKKVGSKGGQSLFNELSKVLGSGGMETAVGQQIISSFEQVGTQGGLGFSKGFTGVLGDLAAYASPALAVLAAALAAQLLADVGGAMMAAVGVGSIALGLAMQFHDPQVHAAAADLGTFLKDQLHEATASFQDPLIQAFSILQTDLAGPLDDLKKAFAVIAPYTQDFAMFLGAAAEKFMPGFTKAIQDSGPIITELGRDIVYIADGLNVFFDEISKGRKGEVEALDATFKILGGTLAGLGFLIRGSADAFDAWVQSLNAVSHYIQDHFGTAAAGVLAGWIDGIARSFNDTHTAAAKVLPEFDALTDAATRQKAAVDALTTAWDKWFGVSMGVDQANLTLHKDFTALTDSIAQNGKVWDLNTKAGQANYGALLQAIQSAHDYRQAEIDSGISMQQANGEYQRNVDWLLQQAGNAGYSASMIQYLKAQVDNLTTSLNSLGQTGWPTVGPDHPYGGYALGGVIPPVTRAAQGILPPRNPGTLVLAGEPQTGGEVMIPQRGISTQRAAMLGSVAMAPYGMAVVPHAEAGMVTGGGGGWGGAPAPIVIQFVVDGRVFHTEVVMPAAQEHKKIYGSTGLT